MASIVVARVLLYRAVVVVGFLTEAARPTTRPAEPSDKESS